MNMYAHNAGIPVAGISYTVDKGMSAHPRRIGRLVVRYEIATDCSERDFQKLIKAGKPAPAPLPAPGHRAGGELRAGGADPTGGIMTVKRRSITIPATVRIKPGALARLGIYLARDGLRHVVLLSSAGLPEEVLALAQGGCRDAGVEIAGAVEVTDASFEHASDLLAQLPAPCAALVGLGGGKALDVAKCVAHLADLPYFAAPTLAVQRRFLQPPGQSRPAGERRSLPARLPRAVVVDTEVCLRRARAALVVGGRRSGGQDHRHRRLEARLPRPRHARSTTWRPC